MTMSSNTSESVGCWSVSVTLECPVFDDSVARCARSSWGCCVARMVVSSLSNAV